MKGLKFSYERYTEGVPFLSNMVLAPYRTVRYTVLTSPNKGEIAVHGYGLSLSILVVFLSRKATFFTQFIYQPCSYVYMLVHFLAD